MYTQCPHCQTLFQVTSAQLKAAQGMVRCGSCHRIFNSLPRLVESMPEAQGKNEKAGDTGRLTPGDIPVVETEELVDKIEITEPPTAQPLTRRITASSKAPPQNKNLPAVTKKEIVPIKPSMPQKVDPTQRIITTALSKKNDPQSLEASRKALHERLARTKHKLLAKQSRNSVPQSLGDDPIISGIIPGNDLINASTADVAPAELNFDHLSEYDVAKYMKSTPSERRKKQRRKGLRRESKKYTALWTVGILGVLLMAFMQAVISIKEDLVKIPSLRPFFQMVCSVVDCEPLMFDAAKLKIIANLDYQRNNPGALKINVKVFNQAELTQYYPVLELVLRDGASERVELFYPVQYLPSRILEREGIPPHKHFSATLNIVNPFHGTRSLSYQINALRKRH